VFSKNRLYKTIEADDLAGKYRCLRIKDNNLRMTQVFYYLTAFSSFRHRPCGSFFTAWRRRIRGACRFIRSPPATSQTQNSDIITARDDLKLAICVSDNELEPSRTNDWPYVAQAVSLSLQCCSTGHAAHLQCVCNGSFTAVCDSKKVCQECRWKRNNLIFDLLRHGQYFGGASPICEMASCFTRGFMSCVAMK